MAVNGRHILYILMIALMTAKAIEIIDKERIVDLYKHVDENADLFF